MALGGGVEEALTSRMAERCWFREAVGGWWDAEGVLASPPLRWGLWPPRTRELLQLKPTGPRPLQVLTLASNERILLNRTHAAGGSEISHLEDGHGRPLSPEPHPVHQPCRPGLEPVS